MTRPSLLTGTALALLATGCVSERVVYVERPAPRPAPPAPAPRPAPRPALQLDEQPDPPSRVARLNFLQGAVSFEPAGSDEWANAVLNYPLKSGDKLWADADGRAEAHLGRVAIRLQSNTSLAFLNLTDDVVHLKLSQGGLELRVRDMMDADRIEVSTPVGAVSLLRPGSYRIDADGDRDRISVTVRHGGKAEVSASGSTLNVGAGQRMTLADGSFDLDDAPRPDGFESWSEGRDRREDDSRTAGILGRDWIGCEDLDDHGTWTETSEFGMIWRPRVAVGWAPYRSGHWAWVAPWGWTWIDDAPWGFAPFHYGRWAYVGGGWAWVPRAPGVVVAARPVYAPALVAFVGNNGGGVALRGGGSVTAWFPLGPRETYVPAYHTSPTYLRAVNVTNVTNVTNITNVTNVTNVTYINRTAPGALTAVPPQVFTGARPVASAAVSVNVQEMAQARTMTAAPVAPQRESLLGGGASLRAAVRPPASDLQRPVVARLAPPPAPVPFAAQQHALQANPGRPVDPGTLGQLRQSAPAPAQPIVHPAATPAAGAAPLRPMREGLPQPQRLQERGFAPANRPAQPPPPTPVPAPPHPAPAPVTPAPAPPRPQDVDRPRREEQPVPRPLPERERPPQPRERMEDRPAPKEARPIPAPSPAPVTPAPRPPQDADRPRREEQPAPRPMPERERPPQPRERMEDRPAPRRETPRTDVPRPPEDRPAPKEAKPAKEKEGRKDKPKGKEEERPRRERD